LGIFIFEVDVKCHIQNVIIMVDFKYIMSWDRKRGMRSAINRLKYYGYAAVVLLSVLALPTAAGAATTSTTINSAISSVISVFTSNGTVTANVTPTGAGAQTIASDTITVSTNDTLGYTLQIADADATTTMVSGANSLAASTGTQASPIAQVVNTWGYRVDSLGGFGAGPTSGQNSAAIGAIKFAGMPANSSPNTIKTTATTASNDTTTVWYGVAANTTQPTGTYSDTVTYTCTAN